MSVPSEQVTVRRAAGTRVRHIALPTEHGGWGFLIEPILLGRLVAPTPAGLLLAVATVAAFLVRQPLKVLLIDRRRGVWTERTAWAWRFVLLYAAVAAVTLLFAHWLAGTRFLFALLLGLPAVVVFAYYDLTRPGRTLQAELAAPVALGTVAPAMALMAGWGWPAALALWAALVLREVPAVIYVRARLRLDKGKPTNVYLPILFHIGAVAGVVWMTQLDLLPPLASVAYAVLFMRATLMLAPRRPKVSVKAIGFMELGLGILTVFIIALGYWLT